jgi:NADH-ubiquinone oxidoreductase chain 5
MPLIGATIAGLMGRFIGEKGAGYITCLTMLLTTFMAWTIFIDVGIHGIPTYLKLFNWIDSGLLTVNMGLQYDSLTAVMLIVVTTISTLVHIFSTGYMKGDPHVPRFMSYLSLFTFFMLILVTADNILQLFIGWEGVGLCSYLLINYWFTRIQANKSAILAMVVNRVGDVAIAIGMFIIYITFGTLEFSTIFAIAPYIQETGILFIGGYAVPVIEIIGILILIGAAGKSAQVGLHIWLPSAMEGPTPVSALIHAATMVTAGVFLIIRCSPLIEYAPTALVVIAIVGAITAFMAATIGVVQNDIKKVIAYSTCSQLGYMVFACGISNYAISVFHLMNHAFFKALLFLSAGCVIHAMADEQDMRKLGGLISTLPFTYSMMVIGSLSLMGFPFLTGFYSKDAILEVAYASYTFQGTFGHWLGTISAFFTAFYSFRLLYLTFISDPLSPQTSLKHSHESPANMSIPLIILAFGSIFVGWFFRDMMIGPGTPFWLDNAIFIRFTNYNLFEAEFLAPSIKFLPVILSILGALLGFSLYFFFVNLATSFKTSIFGRTLYTFLSNKWHWDYIYNSLVAAPIFAWGHNVSYKVLDRGLFEYLGPFGITRLLSFITCQLSGFQSGLVYNYAFSIFIFSTIFLSSLGSWSFLASHADLIILFPILFFLSPRSSL